MERNSLVGGGRSFLRREYNPAAVGCFSSWREEAMRTQQGRDFSLEAQELGPELQRLELAQLCPGRNKPARKVQGASQTPLWCREAAEIITVLKMGREL